MQLFSLTDCFIYEDLKKAKNAEKFRHFFAFATYYPIYWT